MEKTKDLLEALFDYAPIGYYISDLKGSFIDGNIVAQHLTGYKKNELIDKSFLKLNLLGKKDIPRAAMLLTKNLLGKSTGPDEFIIVKKDGSRVVAEISTHPVRVDKKTFVLGVARDVTEIKKARESLEVARIEAEQSAKKAMESDQAKSEFLANMSHEIRTPMNAILGFSELLKEQLKDPNHIRYIDTILSSGKTLLELINDILDLSKIEAKKLELKTGPVNPKDLFNDIARIFSSKIESKGLELITEIDDKLPSAIMLDEVRTRQILFNLVGNAVKFTSSGYIELKVKGRFYPEKSKIDLIFSVRDTGIGICDEEKILIFDAFQQSISNDINKYGGTGLGLTITKRLVELMNGTIELESSPGKGSIFKVTIKNVVISSIKNDELLKEQSVLNIRFKKQKVLIADDVESNRILLSRVLELYNLRTIEALNGKEAINIVKENTPDLILMDLRMPEMDGYEAIRILKADSKYSGIPVIILTASVMKSDEGMIKKMNCQGYVRKPVSREELIKELKKYLEHENIEKADGVGNHTKKNCGDKIKTKTEAEDGKKIPAGTLKNIRKSIISKAEKIKKEFIINDIEDFAVEVKELGMKYNAASLVEWAEKLLKQSSEFDLENLSGTIDEHSSVLNKL